MSAEGPERVDAKPEPGSCPACGEPVRCGMKLREERCWCMDHPPLAPDPALPADACLCERCLRERLARQGASE